MVDTYLTRSHHHTTSDGVQWVRADTSTSGHSPTKSEGGQKVTLERANEQDGLDGVVHAEVKTTVDDDPSDGRPKTTVETGDTIGGKGLAVDIEKAVELTITTYDCVSLILRVSGAKCSQAELTLGSGFSIIGETGTSIVERVDEEERSCACGTTGSQVAHHPLSISITLLLKCEHRLVCVSEREVEGLGREATLMLARIYYIPPGDQGSYYRITLAVLPLHRDITPSFLAVREKHSMIPLYLRSRRPLFNISSCIFCELLFYLSAEPALETPV